MPIVSLHKIGEPSTVYHVHYIKNDKARSNACLSIKVEWGSLDLPNRSTRLLYAFARDGGKMSEHCRNIFKAAIHGEPSVAGPKAHRKREPAVNHS